MTDLNPFWWGAYVPAAFIAAAILADCLIAIVRKVRA